MSPSLIFVRHAAPKIVKGVSSTLWHLSEAGRAAAARLSEQLVAFEPKDIVSSPEPKAMETARILVERLNLIVTPDDGFVEHRRPNLGFASHEEFVQAIRSIFVHPSERLFGGESAHEAYRRFDEALARHAARPLVVVTHGTVLTLFVSRISGLDPMPFWSSLKLPEAFVLDANLQLIARLSA